MKTNIRKILPLALALSLLLCACGQAQKADSQTTSASTEASANTEIYGKIVSVEGSTVTLQLGTYEERTFDKDNMPSGFDPENMPSGFDKNNMPSDFDPENMPSGFDKDNMPSGFDPENMPDGFDKNNMPSGFDPENMPDGFDKDNRPSDFDPENMPGGGKGMGSFKETGESKTITIPDTATIIMKEGGQSAEVDGESLAVDQILKITYNAENTISEVTIIIETKPEGQDAE